MKRAWFIIGAVIIIIAVIVVIVYFFYFADRSTKGVIGFSKKTEFNLNDVTPADRKKISDIITTMGTTSTFGLAFEQGRLERLGNEINHVPPLEFQAVIFSDPQLAYYMRVIRESSMKYNNYVAGLQPGLVKEYQDGYLLEKTKGFAKYLNIPVEKTVQVVKDCSENAVQHKSKLAYKPFVDYLIEQKSPEKNPNTGGESGENDGQRQNGNQKNSQMQNDVSMKRGKDPALF